jgi:hypothetical protein
LSSFSGLVEDVGEEHVDLVKLLARVLFKAATATALASTGFSTKFRWRFTTFASDRSDGK